MAQEFSNNKPNIYDKLIAFLRDYYVQLRKNRVLFILIFLVLTGAAVFLNAKKSNTYSASFTVVYEELVRKVYGDRLDKLNLLLKNDKSKAQQLLGISDEAAASLKEISATNILGENLSTDMNTDKIPFIINMYIKDAKYVQDIQNGIINYLETSNAYLIEKRRLKRKEIEEELAYIEQELSFLDTLKKKQTSKINMSVGASSDKSASSSEGSGAIYQVSYELYKKRQELIKKKEMPMNLYVIDDAIVPVKNNKPYLLVVIASFIATVFIYTIIAYFVLPVLYYDKRK